MRTCQVTSVHKRYDTRIFLKIACSLAANGCESYLLCIDNKPSEIIDKVHIVSMGFSYKSKFKRIIFSWRKLRKPCLTINADIYQLHDPELLPLGIFLKRHKKKVIFDSHEDYQNIVNKKYIPRFLRVVAQKYYLYREKRSLSFFDGVISVTPSIVKRLEKINSNTILITNYPILCEKYTHDFSNNNICFGGSAAGWAHTETIRALEILHDKSIRYEFVFQHRTITGKEIPLLQTWRSMSGWQYVISHDLMTFEEFRKVYKRSCIGMCLMYSSVNTNETEGTLGNTKFFEYMSEGMPIICSNFKIFKNIIEEYSCGICVDPYNPQEIAAAIKKMLMNRELMKRMGINGRKAAEEKFNWTTQVEKLIKFYNDIYSNKRNNN